MATRKLPEVIITWLRYVPAAMLSALLFPAILVENCRLYLTWDNLYLLALLPTLLVAQRTRSMFGAVGVGILLVAAGRLLFHLQ